MLLQRTVCGVACQGELVIVKFGDVGYSIEFPLALTIAAAMHHEARIARLAAGIKAGGLNCLGMLTDLSAPKPKRKRFMEKLPEILHANNCDVQAEGTLVCLSLGTATRKLEHDGARAFAQMLRVHGKEAKRNAGEIAHWSKINNAGEIADGKRSLH
jgi:hypothetical protein